MGPLAGTRLLVHAWIIVFALLLGVALPQVGAIALGLALLALVAWLIGHDVARRTIRAAGITRYMAACILCGYVWLQLWDRISLDVCRHGFAGWSGEYPPVPATLAPDSEVVRLRVSLEPGGVCRLDPYPLLERPFRASVPAVRIPRGAVGDHAALRRSWRAGGGSGAFDVTFLPA